MSGCSDVITICSIAADNDEDCQDERSKDEDDSLMMTTTTTMVAIEMTCQVRWSRWADPPDLGRCIS